MSNSRRLVRPVPDTPSVIVDLNEHNSSAVQNRRIIVLGAGGHGRELADIIRAVGSANSANYGNAENDAVELLGVVDDAEPDRIVLARSGTRYLGDRTALAGMDAEVHLGVGYPHVRARIDEELGFLSALPIVHPSAFVGSGSTLAEGVVIAQGAIVTTNVRLGRHTHVNVAASVSHDCVVGDYVTICPQAALTGSASIGSCSFIGSGAMILPGVSIGENVTVGAGAVVAADVPSNTTVAGVPARPIQ